MKKIPICVLMLALLIASCPAFAAEVLEPGVICELFEGTLYDLDGDGTTETIKYTVIGDEYSSEGFSLSIGDAYVEDNGCYMTGRVHAVRMSEDSGECLIFVSDYGMSDDDTSYIYSYRAGSITQVGTIYTMPWDLTATGRNTFTGTVRSSYLQSWYRPCDYVITSELVLTDDEAYSRTVSIDEMPRSEYPLGQLVTVTRDIDLQVSRTNGTFACRVKAGEKAILVATDDIEWLYIARTDGTMYEYEYSSGWFRTDIGGWSCEINGEEVETYELFEGLFYAD